MSLSLRRIKVVLVQYKVNDLEKEKEKKILLPFIQLKLEIAGLKNIQLYGVFRTLCGRFSAFVIAT